MPSQVKIQKSLKKILEVMRSKGSSETERLLQMKSKITLKNSKNLTLLKSKYLLLLFFLY